MQTYGLGTALKIQSSKSPREFSGRLERNELVALINTFAKVSSSINSIDLMYERRKRYHFNLIITITIVGSVLKFFMILIQILYTDLDMPTEDQSSNFDLKDKLD